MSSSPVELASTDPEEIALIARWQSDFGSRAVCREYADWLASRNPSRAAFVRDLESAFFDAKSADAFPESSEQEGVWSDAIGTQLLRELLKDELRSVQAEVFQWVRPVVAIEALPVKKKDALPPGTTKFGGLPDVPAGFEWPTCELGPLGFLGQIAIHDIRHSVATQRFGLPTEGQLLLFAFQGDGIEPGGTVADNGRHREPEGMTQVVFIPANTPLQTQPAPDGLGEFNGPFPCCRLLMKDGLDLPVAKDTPSPSLIAAEEDWHISDLRSLVNPGLHWLMGHPVHNRTENTSPGPDWMTLVTLGSDDALGWSWCDGEHLDVYVHADSVKDGTFSKVYGYAS